MGRIFAVCSGVGGVGRSMIALSLAVGSAKSGKRTVLLDASGMARSCDLIMGMESVVVLDMMDVLKDQVSIHTALYPVPRHERLKFACAALYENVSASDLSGIVLALQTLCDILIVDLPCGQTDLGSSVLKEGDERLIIMRPDDVSIRASERLISRAPFDQVGTNLVINRMSRERIKRKTQYDQDTVQMLLDRVAVGCIPEDPCIADGEKKGKAAIESDGPARAALQSMIKKLIGGTM